jgi:hypothetical protein
MGRRADLGLNAAVVAVELRYTAPTSVCVLDGHDCEAKTMRPLTLRIFAKSSSCAAILQRLPKPSNT